jgi:hypothetical protein
LWKAAPPLKRDSARKADCLLPPLAFAQAAYSFSARQTFLQTNMQRLVAVLEAKIRQHPAHFAMIFHINQQRSRLGLSRAFSPESGCLRSVQHCRN